MLGFWDAVASAGAHVNNLPHLHLIAEIFTDRQTGRQIGRQESRLTETQTDK